MNDEIININKDDVIKYIKEHNLNLKGRQKRELVDPRNFCINLLYYGFEETEETIAEIVNKDRSSVNHAKDLAFHLKKDPIYLKNTEQVRKMFSEWTPPTPYRRHSRANRKFAITIFFDAKQYNKLKEYRDIIGTTTITRAAKKLLFHKLSKL